MPQVESSWLVGSITLPDATALFDSEDVVLPGGTYYLRHPTAALSLVDVVRTAINDSLSSITCTSLVVLENRRTQINLSTAADLIWATGFADSAEDWAAVLGFSTGDLTLAASYTSSGISPLLFSAGYPARPKTQAGITGYTVLKQAFLKAADGSVTRRVGFGNETWQELDWGHIVPSRLQSTGSVLSQGGTFHQFFEQSLSLGLSMLHYEDMIEDAASTTAASWSTPLGPYQLRDGFDGNWYARNVANAEISSPLSLPLLAVEEY
ncbi:MAG: hypothetical protein IPH07_24410 [Deltaproteobacteria bacterium]|nr:hypothetical protein [Deltaproteobacteria bacterium]